MAFFKRIEVWVLLGLTVAGVAAVLRMDQENGGRGTGTRERGEDGPVGGERGDGRGDSGTEVSARHWIESLNIERDGDHAVVEVLVHTRDDEVGKDSRTQTPPRLLRADGSEVPPFFVPFQDAAGATDPGSSHHGRGLLFWADAGSLAGALFLEVNGERLTVKSADDFQLEKIDDGGRATLSVDDQARTGSKVGGEAS